MTSQSGTFELIKRLALIGDVTVSLHGYRRMARDGLSLRQVVAGISVGTLVEDYPGFGKGPCCLVLQADDAGSPVHVLWEIEKGIDRPAVVITTYRPDPEKWSSDLLRRN